MKNKNVKEKQKIKEEVIKNGMRKEKENEKKEVKRVLCRKDKVEKLKQEGWKEIAADNTNLDARTVKNLKTWDDLVLMEKEK